MTLQLNNPENPIADIKLTLCIHLPTCGLPMYIVEEIATAIKWYVEGPRDYVNLDMLTEAREGCMADYWALQKALQNKEVSDSWRRVWLEKCEDDMRIVAHLDSLITALENPASFSVEG